MGSNINQTSRNDGDNCHICDINLRGNILEKYSLFVKTF